MNVKRLAAKPTTRPARRKAATSNPDLPSPAAANIVIEVDASLVGGTERNRFDVTIRGRARSALALTQIRIEIAGVIAGAAYFPPDETITETTPRQRIFQFLLQQPLATLTERCDFRIVAQDASGQEQAQDFALSFNIPGSVPILLVSGPALPAHTLATFPPDGFLRVERATVDENSILAVEGWAVAFDEITAIQISACGERITDNTLIGDAVVGLGRRDVGLAMPIYSGSGQSGFELSRTVRAVDHVVMAVHVRVLCQNGLTLVARVPVERISDMRTRPVQTEAIDEPASDPANQTFLPDSDEMTVSAGKPQIAPSFFRMYCDAAELTSDGDLTVNGWAVCDIGVAQVRVLLDERFVGLAVCGHERFDVGQAFRDIPMADFSGFKFQAKLPEQYSGNHALRVIVRNARLAEIEHVAELTVIPAEPEPGVQEPDRPPAPEVTPAESPAQANEFRFELDAPVIANGAVVEPVTGRLTIDGWLLSRSGIESFVVYLDEQRLGDVHYGLARQDVGAAFPEWPNSLRSGYAFHCPPRSLSEGEHMVRLAIRARNGLEMERSFSMTVKKSDDQNDQTLIRRRVQTPEVDLLTGLLADRNHRPAFRLILRAGPSFNTAEMTRTINSIVAQAYPNWSVVVLADNDKVATAIRILLVSSIPHLLVRFTFITPSLGAPWTAPLAGLESDGVAVFYGLMSVGDETGADALLELAVASAFNADADLLYGDEVRPTPVTEDREQFFKPDYSPDLLLAMNYFGRPWIVSRDVLAKTGVSPASLAADGEYDLTLRCAELARRVHHVQKLLCQRVAPHLDEPAQEAAALNAALHRRGIAGQVLPAAVPGTWRVKRQLPSHGKVSIIVPTCAAHGYIETCIKTLRNRTSYPDYEIIVVDNIPSIQLAWKVWVQQNADKVVEIADDFNWSVFNNRAVDVADGDYLLFLNDDIEIIQDDWLDAMIEHAQRPEVGITGARLLYPDGKVQHAGMFLANNGIGRHAFRFAAPDDPGYFGLALVQRNVMAVTGACLLVRRETFDRLGRFDEAHQIVNNDLDFCLRVHRAGLLTVITPYATLTHHELASRALLKDVFNTTHFDSSWKTQFAAGDPYFNPRLSRHSDDYRPDDEAVQWVTPGAPVFHAEDIERILVVKLDHIGDFVTALPPIRRLKQIFPKSTITVLAGPASRAFASLEPAIDEFIPFAFFHARSQLGEKHLEKQDFIALQEQLRPYRFDLAVDLRKHTSTRDVLNYTGARFLAGYDYQGQFPFLDIALDWDGDRTLQRKRSHVIDDLLALVNAIGHATQRDRLLMQPTPEPLPLDALPSDIQTLFSRTVVAIHPGAGNITKQWPTEHFSALIDLLIDRHGVNILLVGGPDEVEVVDDLLKRALHPHAVASMAGKTSLADLPRLLLRCALYIGNDSGPKHIAAAVGIPTIGVHSGVVDPVEWGPLGPRAVALRRNMTCSPCYLANAEDCPRSLACLRLLEPNLVYEAARMLLPVPPVPPAEPVAQVAPAPKTASRASNRRKLPQTAS